MNKIIGTDIHCYDCKYDGKRNRQTEKCLNGINGTNGCSCWEAKPPFTKSDLQDTDIVTKRNSMVCLWKHMCDIAYKEDLRDSDGITNFDIIKVERPTNLVTVYEREETVKVSLDELVKLYEKVKGVKVEVE